MLSFDSISLRRGSKLLLADATLTLHRGDKVGLVGANGAGKSSLFALILGQLQEDAGTMQLASGTVVAHVMQETLAAEMAAIDYVLQGDGEYWALQGQLAQAEAAEDGERMVALHTHLERIGGYSARARAARLMHGLGFVPGEEERSVASFSGGWRMRLNLARALMCRSDLLLLDEPTNHLDLDAVLWLEQWLRDYEGAMLLISHDRDFLDRAVVSILHLGNERLTLYAGNYSAYETMRAEALAQQQSAFEKQQRQIAHMTSFIDRFRAKATKARQAQSRIKALERMQRIAPAHVDSPFNFEFREAGRAPSPLLRLHKASIGYGERTILAGLSFSLLPGDRLGLLGPNGAGKTTLVKLLAGAMAPLSGQCETARELSIGYFAQHQLEQLHSELTPLQHLQMLDAAAGEVELRSFLGGFGFPGEMATSPVGPRSGGEKARLVLALIAWQRPNLLLLDEPTNHLDLETRHALTLALQEFAGAMVLVSHDRHLLRTVCDEFLLVDGGVAEPFAGDLDDYAHWLAARRREREKGSEKSGAGEARKAQRAEQSQQRKQTQALSNRIKKLEDELARLQADKAKIDATLADPALYEAGDLARMRQLDGERLALEEKLDSVEADWLQAHEELEALS